MAVDVELGQLAEVAFVKFLDCKVTPPPPLLLIASKPENELLFPV